INCPVAIDLDICTVSWPRTDMLDRFSRRVDVNASFDVPHWGTKRDKTNLKRMAPRTNKTKSVILEPSPRSELQQSLCSTTPKAGCDSLPSETKSGTPRGPFPLTNIFYDAQGATNQKEEL